MPALAGGGDRGAALRSLGYGLERKPNDPWLLIAQAQVQMQIADFANALATLDGAVAGATSPIERRPAFYFRGHANLDLGNYAQAAARLRCRARGPDDAQEPPRHRAVALRRPGARPGRTRAAC